jgi:Zn finger protein HypA/HybF involved in hydrogenase expression
MEEDSRRDRAGEEVPDDKCEVNPHHYWQYCVNCGTMLQSRKCKLICPKCGFYHSCSEP